MLSILPTTNYNMNFKATSNMPDLPTIEKAISAITAGEVIPKEAVQQRIPKILPFLSSIPLIGYFANLYISHVKQKNKQAEQEKKLKDEALKVDSDGKTMVLRLLAKNQFEAFRKHVEKYPDVLLIRANNGCSCLVEAVYKYEVRCITSTLVNYIAEKLVSNPDYNPNKKLTTSFIKPNKFKFARKGDTDAHILARCGMLSALKIIASHPETDFTIRNADGKTCMDVALEEGKTDIVNFLTTVM